MSLVYWFLLALFLLLVVILVGVILIQEPKSGGLSMGIGGGGVETFLGARGAPTFFTKATVVLGALYMLLSLALSLMAGSVQGTTSVVEREVKQGTLADKYRLLFQEQGQQGQGGPVR